ncbi:MAG: hypothetical protein ACD_75C02241G0003 [uncultured bacterium]|nr:MAG: hypothetical protein ACD_75C02241G0003 [uncultured bacterium]
MSTSRVCSLCRARAASPVWTRIITCGWVFLKRPKICGRMERMAVTEQ